MMNDEYDEYDDDDDDDDDCDDSEHMRGRAERQDRTGDPSTMRRWRRLSQGTHEKKFVYPR